MIEQDKIYANTAAGAVDCLLADNTVFTRESLISVARDQQVAGVWLIRHQVPGTKKTGSVIVYLAGYPDPWGQLREWNDFECDY